MARGERKLFPNLPCKPLADYILVMSLDEERQDDVFSPIARRANVEGRLDALCQTIGVDARTVNRWWSGELKSCKFDTADSVLCKLGVLWFDIPGWDNDPTVRYAFTGER